MGILRAVAGSASVVPTALIAREMGGRRYAQSFAPLCMTAAPVYLVLTGFFSMNAFDLLFRTLAFYVLTVIVRTGNAKLFVLMGFILGLGLLSKIGVLFLGSGLALGLMPRPARGYLKSS